MSNEIVIYGPDESLIDQLRDAAPEGVEIQWVDSEQDPDEAARALSNTRAIILGGAIDFEVELAAKCPELRLVQTTSAGTDKLDKAALGELGIKVSNNGGGNAVAVAEHTIALTLALNRKLIQANAQVKQYNFTLDNLMGFDLNGKTVGIFGTGRIGSILVKIFHAFGCKVVAHDLHRNPYLENHYDLEYLPLEKLCRLSDIITINVPLNYETHHILHEPMFLAMKEGALLVNTARGGIVKTEDLVEVLKGGHLGGYATDVYEYERGVFYKDNRKTGITDDLLKQLIEMPNVILTPHQAFATKEALLRIAETTMYNLDCWEEGNICKNELGFETVTL